MDYGAKSMAVSNTANVDINIDMDDVLKRIQSSRNVAGRCSHKDLDIFYVKNMS